MVKTYVLDTNVLLSDANSLFAFHEHNVIVPLIVLEELDRHKSRADGVGKNARDVNRTLDEMRQNGDSLVSGVKLPQGGMLKVVPVPSTALNELPHELQSNKADNLIIALVLNMTKHAGTQEEPVLVSRDINVRIKCDSLGVKAEDYRNIRVVSEKEQMYRGVEVVHVDKEYIDAFFEVRDGVQLPDDVLASNTFYPNQIVVLKHITPDGTTKSALSRHIYKGEVVQIKPVPSAFGLQPRNKEQTFALDLLYDDDVKLVTLSGIAGGGKTIIALAAALDQLVGIGSRPKYNKLIVMRTVQPVGKDIGFLPGTLQEKMEPWLAPIRDNLNFLVENKSGRNRGRHSGGSRGGSKRGGGAQKETGDESVYLSLMQERGLIELEAITYIRGRSIPNAFILVDEAQNLSPHEVKTILTRVGEGTKVVMTGDYSQIDNVHVDVYTNGLTYAIERFKEHPIAGHVSLIKGERSSLATLASELL